MEELSPMTTKQHDHTCSDSCAASEEHMRAMETDADRQVREAEMEWDIDANRPVYTEDFLALVVHKRNSLYPDQPVCGTQMPSAGNLEHDLDKVNCADCLRALAKDAAKYIPKTRTTRERRW